MIVRMTCWLCNSKLSSTISRECVQMMTLRSSWRCIIGALIVSVVWLPRWCRNLPSNSGHRWRIARHRSPVGEPLALCRSPAAWVCITDSLQLLASGLLSRMGNRYSHPQCTVSIQVRSTPGPCSHEAGSNGAELRSTYLVAVCSL